MRSEAPTARRVALVTGAGSGIGRALALGLSRAGWNVGLAGRRGAALDEVAAEAAGAGGDARRFRTDLLEPGSPARLGALALGELGRVDLLVHSAWLFPERAGDEALVRKHPRAAEELTRALLPELLARRGQIVFINSSAGLPGIVREDAYAESKQELRRVADQLRDEVHHDGVRVLSVFPGRTATAMQEAVHRLEGRPYLPELLLQPEEVASVVMQALNDSGSAEVTDITIPSVPKARE